MHRRVLIRQLAFGLVVASLCLWVVPGRVFQSPASPRLTVRPASDEQPWDAQAIPPQNQVHLDVPRDGVIATPDRAVMYWLQVSDTHLHMRQPERLTNFQRFCNETIPAIAPAFVLSTGDNVDGNYTEDYYAQDEHEYQFYNATLQANGYNASFWYPIPGNHDRYNTGVNRSLYLRYIRNETLYAVDARTPFGVYRFVLTDTTQAVGARNFLCLFGEMRTPELDQVERLLALPGPAGAPINQTVVLGHHPLNQVYSEETTSGASFEGLFDRHDVGTYLCGHLHIDDLYYNHGHVAELQCPSFKDFYRYRICAYDDDVFSFSDETLDEWPAVVVTSPTDARFYTPTDPLERVATHDEVRVLIFDPAPVMSAHVEVDGTVVGNLTAQGNHLWAVPWDPSAFATGQHEMRVHVRTDSGSTVRTLMFALDDFTSAPPASVLGYGLWFPIITVLWGLLILNTIWYFGEIVVPKLYARLHPEKIAGLTPADLDREDSSFFEKHYLKRWLQAAQLPALDTLLLVGLYLYLVVGPILVLPLVHERVGFLWLNRFTVDGRAVLEITGLLVAWGFGLACLFLQGYVIRGYRNNPKWARFFLLVFYATLAGIFYLVQDYFGVATLALNPLLYLYGLGGLVLAWRAERSK